MKRLLYFLMFCMFHAVAYATTWYRDANPIDVGGTTVLHGVESSNSNTTTYNSWSCSGDPIVRLTTKNNGLSCEVTGLSPGTTQVKCTVTSYNSTSGTSYNYIIYNVTVNEPVIEPGTWSGNTLTIGGNATDSNYDVPYNNWYRYSTVQALYTPKEIGKGGTISSIAFKVANASSFPTSEVKVYLGHKSGIFTSESDYVKSSNLTLVYDGKPTLGQSTGWETLTFNKGSFTYNGTDNLVVVVTRKSDNYTGSLKYYYYTGSGFTLYRRSDSDTGYGEVTNTYSYTKSTDRPTIRMVFATSQGTTTGDIAINATNFPDANFRNFLLSESYGQDGVLTESEIAGVKSIDVDYKSISTLKGIEHFTALTKLWCSSNQLTSLDVSKNTALTWLYCYSNQLTSLDVSKNTALKYLTCYNNQLTSLDVSKNTALKDMDCSSNQLTTLDVSKNTALTGLSCYGNQLTSLDVSKNTALTILGCYGNQLTSLDVSKNTALTGLSCVDNQLTSLDVSKNTALTILGCYGNKIKGSNMDNLINSLRQNNTTSTCNFFVINNSNGDEGNVCTKSQVAAVKAKGWNPQYWDGSSWVEYEGSEDEEPASDIAINETNFPDENFRNWLLQQSYGSDGILTQSEINGITSIDIRSKQIKNLKGIEYFTALTTLKCGYNQLTSLDVSNCTSLTILECYYNQLTSLDVSNCTALTDLQCHNNQLTSLDVSNCTALTDLQCHNNQLTSLDVFKNTALKYLACSSNQLTSLDVSKNTALTNLSCDRNKINCSNMDNLINSLRQNNTTSTYNFYVIDNRNGDEGNICTKSQVAAVKAKGWTPKYYNGSSWVEYEGSEDNNAIVINGLYYAIITSNDINDAINEDDGLIGVFTPNTDVAAITSAPKGSEYTGAIKIPSSIEHNGITYAVEALIVDAFAGTSITSVLLPNSIRLIAAGAFQNCTGLSTITIPSSVKCIFEDAFSGCTGLTSIISEIVEPFPVKSSVFKNVTATLYVPKGTKAKYEATEGWNQLTIEELGEGLKDGDEFASNVTESLTLWLKVISAENKTCEVICLSDRKWAGALTIPATIDLFGYTVTAIGRQAFCYYNNLTSITIPNTVTTIGDEAFNSCRSLTSITIPNSVTSIGEEAFAYCTGLTSITIPNSVISIGENAFANTGLTSITIPSSVTSLGRYTFEGCASLSSIIVESGNVVYDSRNDCNAIIESATNTLIKGCNNSTIPNSVTSIGESSFYNCTGLTSIVIPNSVTSIGRFAFSECRGLASVTMSNSLTSIGEYAFDYCKALTSITIPSSVTSIGERVFDGCSGLRSIVSEIEEPFDIGTDVFNSYKPLNFILYVPSGTKSKYEAAEGWNQLTIDEIGSENKFFIAESTDGKLMTFKVTDEANKTCQVGDGKKAAVSTGISNVIVPMVADGYTVTAIAANAFADLKIECVIPNSITYIGENAFKDIYSLLSFIEEPFEIPENTFSNTTYGTSLIIPYGSKDKYLAQRGWSSFTRIYEDFAHVNGIFCWVNGPDSKDPYTASVVAKVWSVYEGDIIIPETFTIGDETFTVVNIAGAFKNSQITSVSIPKSVSLISSGSFANCSQLHTVKSFILEPWDFSEAFSDLSSNATMFVPFGTKEAYESIANWNMFARIGEMDSSGRCDGDTFVENDITYQIISVSEKTAQLKRGADVNGVVNIPSEVNGYTVTAIGKSAFTELSNITAVSIPASVTSIGETAFYGCGNLTSVTVNWPTPIAIDNECFTNAANATLNVPKGSYEIYAGAENWKDFNTIKEPAHSVGETFVAYVMVDGAKTNARYKVTDATSKYVNIGNGEECAISDFTSGSVVVPSSVTGYDGQVYQVKQVAPTAFYGCTEITSIELPSGITTLGRTAFYQCSSISSFNIPTTVTTIGQKVFQGCEKLSSISIPSSVTSIGSYAFDCNNLTSVTVEWEDPIAISTNCFSNAAKAVLYVPVGTNSKYKAATGWKNFGQIANGVENVLAVYDAIGRRGGKVVLPILMNNEDDITSVSFKLIIPNGFSLTEYALTDRKGDHIVYPEPQSDGSYLITAFSINNQKFSGSEGPVMNLTIDIDGNLEPGDYAIVIKDIELSTEYYPIYPAKCFTTLSVDDFLAGDANGNGEVTPFDAVLAIKYYLGRNPYPFWPTAANVNGDKKDNGEENITPFDAVSIVRIYLNNSNSKNISRRRTYLEEEKEPQ